MEHEIDKEMDVIIRSALAGESRRALPDAHFDSDEIAAFIADALPATYRSKMIVHFADCGRCRSILSSAISQNDEFEYAEPATVAAPVLIDKKAPWYNRILSVIKPVYAMGALVLLFGGFFGFIALQSFQEGSNEVSQVANKIASTANESATNYSSESAKAAPAETELKRHENSNSYSIQDDSQATKRPPTGHEADDALTRDDVEKSKIEPSMESSADDSKEEGSKNAEPELKRSEAVPGRSRTQPTVAPAPPPPPPPAAAIPADREDRALPKPAQKSAGPDRGVFRDNRLGGAASENSGNVRNAGGKRFVKTGNEWRDSAYSTQPLVYVKRRSNDYDKLDSGLRSIAGQFSETVVIVWKSKAYRIY